ncbi:MarR family winged helix-turn-helix transcriptional regulator [Hymenobacter sp. 5516J-16]|uniref:MarR family winged helix-turn-helix transcriptional regulator n=1 Tax=Hymenobacter sp. 5516J-16 TaxID=2932253 RepID=UPI00293E88C7|nr:MarR family winged helix-turn-helix transcriptional regulator [Hymenobacter sp. 5516J-16]
MAASPYQRPPDTTTVSREQVHVREFDESRISKLITFLSRYARSYSRLALRDSPLTTLEDFTYLATLNAYQPLSKTDLIGRNIHEKSGGMEVIRRLHKQGLVTEQMHSHDRRSRVLMLSDSGREVLFQLFERMEQVARVLAGNLNAPERQQLLYLLLKLDAYHYPRFHQQRAKTLDELLDAYEQ